MCEHLHFSDVAPGCFGSPAPSYAASGMGCVAPRVAGRKDTPPPLRPRLTSAPGGAAGFASRPGERTASRTRASIRLIAQTCRRGRRLIKDFLVMDMHPLRFASAVRLRGTRPGRVDSSPDPTGTRTGAGHSFRSRRQPTAPPARERSGCRSTSPNRPWS